MKSQLPKIIVAVLLVLILAFIAYFYYTKKGFSGINFGGFNLSGLVLPKEEAEVGSDILVLAEKIKMTVIDPEVFSSQLFMNLVDFTVPVLPEEQGKPNPFSSLIGLESGNLSQQSSSIANETQSTQPSGGRTASSLKIIPTR